MSGKETPLRQCSQHRRKVHTDSLDVKKNKKKAKETPKLKELKLESEEANKSFYLCSLEHSKDWAAYVVRTLKLSELLLSSPADDPVPLQQVAYEAGSDLPGSVGCGLWGSQIVFTGGVTPCCPHGFGDISADSVWHTYVYAFETLGNAKKIRKLDANFQGAKLNPFTVELGGKLYALSYWMVGDPPSFEVFDPAIGRWEGLPQPPFLDFDSPCSAHGSFSYAVAGTKLFVSHDERQGPVFCFDVAHPNRDWREVPTLCDGCSFPFDDQALVLDLQGDNDKKIMFGYSYEPWSLLVYLMSLSENQETITKIGDLRMPRVPGELGRPQCCQLLHIGGQKACVVVSQIEQPVENEPPYDELGSHNTHGALIPFQFELDMTKDKNNCLELQFMPLRSFKYHTNPSTYPGPETVGCFLL